MKSQIMEISVKFFCTLNLNVAELNVALFYVESQQQSFNS
jgi:hypothetical protein